MGCFFSHEKRRKSNSPSKTETTYSWDSRRSQLVDSSKFICENLSGGEEIRLPGSVNGQQFIIQNCKKTTVFVLDHLNTVTVDDCVDCTIILGTVTSSVFLRNCIGCVCIAACGQFRSRDCQKCNIHLYSSTQPIIEASTRMKFGKFKLSYDGLSEHLEMAGLNLNLTTWDEVHDFTPLESDTNWRLLNDSGSRFALHVCSETVFNALCDLNVKWAKRAIPLKPLESVV